MFFVLCLHGANQPGMRLHRLMARALAAAWAQALLAMDPYMRVPMEEQTLVWRLRDELDPERGNFCPAGATRPNVACRCAGFLALAGRCIELMHPPFSPGADHN